MIARSQTFIAGHSGDAARLAAGQMALTLLSFGAIVMRGARYRQTPSIEVA